MQALPLIIGHRGSSRIAPENTLASFRLAWQEGSDGIEADFRLSSDGAIVCMHDSGTGRTGDRDFDIAAAALAELRTLDIGRWKGERWTGERIPTLQEVLEQIPPGKRLFIELKSGLEIIAPLAELLNQSGVGQDQIRLLAFSAPLIQAVKQALPAYKACWLTDYRFRVVTGSWSPSREEIMATLRELGCDGLASRCRSILDHDFVSQLRREGLEIHVWTVDSLKDARRLVSLGVDSIMTNRPGWLRHGLGNDQAGGRS